jgi:hypothetical protein
MNSSFLNISAAAAEKTAYISLSDTLISADSPIDPFYMTCEEPFGYGRLIEKSLVVAEMDREACWKKT